MKWPTACPSQKARCAGGVQEKLFGKQGLPPRGHAGDLEATQETLRPPASLGLWSSCQASLSRWLAHRKEPAIEVTLLATC
jgi:hypothetical protein